MVDIFLATTNQHKVGEIKAFFADTPDIRFTSWLDFPNQSPLDIEENAPDFAGNALLKATHTAAHLQKITLADDSGLEIKALGGFPSVHSARWAGDVSQEVKNNLLLEKLRHQSNRSARYVAVLALVDPIKNEQHLFHGICNGQIAISLSGSGGFGYDPLFIPDEADGQTFGELSLEVKNTISHRALALKELKSFLRKTALSS